MQSIKTDHWARIAVLLIAAGVVLGAIQVMPVFDGVVDILGPGSAALLALGVLALLLLLLFPYVWPWLRARRLGLPHPWMFVLVVWGLTVGLTETLVALIALPAALFDIYFGPQLHEWNLLSSSSMSVLSYIAKYWFLAIYPLQIIISIVATRLLSRRWSAIQSFKP